MKRQLSILVADDAYVERLAAIELAEEANFNVIEAGSAAEALSLVGGRRSINVAWVDLDLFEMPHGQELAEALRAHHKIKVVLASHRKGLPSTSLPILSARLRKPYHAPSVLQVLDMLATESDA